MFPVNPNAERVEGDPCFPDLQSIPGGVDGVVIVTRPQLTEEIVRQCPAAGVKRVWRLPVDVWADGGLRAQMHVLDDGPDALFA